MDFMITTATPHVDFQATAKTVRNFATVQFQTAITLKDVRVFHF